MIDLPPESERVTAEAELGVIIGRRMPLRTRSEVPPTSRLLSHPRHDRRGHPQRNPRFLTAQELRHLLVLRTELITRTRCSIRCDWGRHLENGAPHPRTWWSSMAFPPYYLVAFHSKS